MSVPVEIPAGWLNEGVKGFLSGKGEFVSLMHLDCTDCGIIDASTGEIPLPGKCANGLRLRFRWSGRQARKENRVAAD